jgi:hypothetical protein
MGLELSHTPNHHRSLASCAKNFNPLELMNSNIDEETLNDLLCIILHAAGIFNLNYRY